ncbi:MAG: MFS transporter [Candidatus Howiella sp.]|jgi:Na+/melibiose symporter-like transporter
MKNSSILSQSIAGGFLTTVTDIYWNGALTCFYIKNMGLSIKSAGIVMVIFVLFNAFDNLIAGSIADRSDNKLGRRIPYIRACGPLMGLFFCLSFFKPSFITSQFFIAAGFLMFLCLIDFCVAFLEVSLYSIPYEETLEKTVRGKVFIWQAVFMLISIGVSVVLIPEIQPDSTEDSGVYRMIMGIIGIVSGLGIFVCSYFIDSTYRPDQDSLMDYSMGFLLTITVWVGLTENTRTPLTRELQTA